MLCINDDEIKAGEGKTFQDRYITDDCTECGVCAEECPQKAIDEGTPYVIRQENCLHCGRCVEECPAEIIVRRSETEA